MLVPKLKFRREDGTEYPEWKSMLLGERFTFKNGINASREAFRAEGIHCIGVSDVYKCLPIIAENVIGTVAVSDDEIEKNKVNYGDVLFQRSSETKEDIGHASVYFDDTPSVYNGFVICAKPDKLFYVPLYLHYSLQHTRIRKQTITLGAGSGQHYNIGQEGLAQINVVFPCLEEQQRISDLVFSVDEVIAQSEAEVQNLEQQKKAAMQKIFSQEVRFKREDGSEYPEWEEKQLGDFLSLPESKEEVKAKSTNDLITVKLHNGGVCVSAEKTLKFGATKYYKRYAGQFIYGIQNFHNGAMGIVPKKLDGKATSNFIPSMNIHNINPQYLLTYISRPSYYKSKEAYSCGNGSKLIHESVLQEFEISIPSDIEEQQKIADFLSAYDEAISYAKQELEHWKQLKKGLLQQMFV